MDSEISTLKRTETVALKLRRLYEQHGYVKYRMNQFEEYAFYMENRNFLRDDKFITFTDRGGRLMALKPDITLSIAKNVREDGTSQRLYYSENIYRTAPHTGDFCEINQTGLEFIGSLDIYKTTEVLTLALKSLAVIDSSFVLTVSHMGIVSGLLDSLQADYAVRKKLIQCIQRKNAHDAARICDESGIPAEEKERILGVLAIGGPVRQEAEKLRALARPGEMQRAAEELYTLGVYLEKSEFAGRVVLDFDTVSHTQYYNGLLFCGYIEGVASAALVGGRYDRLLERMGKGRLQAMGFAIDFYVLDRFLKEKNDRAVNAVVLYGAETDPALVARTAESLIAQGLRTVCERELPPALRYDTVVDLREKTDGGNEQ